MRVLHSQGVEVCMRNTDPAPPVSVRDRIPAGKLWPRSPLRPWLARTGRTASVPGSEAATKWLLGARDDPRLGQWLSRHPMVLLSKASDSPKTSKRRKPTK
jgi:hypothetical protein